MDGDHSVVVLTKNKNAQIPIKTLSKPGISLNNIPHNLNSMINESISRGVEPHLAPSGISRGLIVYPQVSKYIDDDPNNNSSTSAAYECFSPMRVIESMFDQGDWEMGKNPMGVFKPSSSHMMGWIQKRAYKIHHYILIGI